jgi:hypothetical protein
MSNKFCIDCKHYKTSVEYDCYRIKRTSLIQGEVYEPRFAHNERYAPLSFILKSLFDYTPFDVCGSEGKYWEAKS